MVSSTKSQPAAVNVARSCICVVDFPAGAVDVAHVGRTVGGGGSGASVVSQNEFSHNAPLRRLVSRLPKNPLFEAEYTR